MQHLAKVQAVRQFPFMAAVPPRTGTVDQNGDAEKKRGCFLD